MNLCVDPQRRVNVSLWNYVHYHPSSLLCGCCATGDQIEPKRGSPFSHYGPTLIKNIRKKGVWMSAHGSWCAACTATGSNRGRKEKHHKALK